MPAYSLLSPKHKYRPMGACVLCLLLLIVFAYRPGHAEVYTLNEDSDLVGELGCHVTSNEDTLLDVARTRNLGYVELLAANPGVDPWVPGPNVTLTLPTAHVLPGDRREGVVINLPEQRLYNFLPDGAHVQTFPVGIGRAQCETPTGDTKIEKKRVSPTWLPPADVRAERPDLPKAVLPGPDNPLGDYALNLDWQGYIIHGTNRPFGIGRRVSHGCIRLYPEDIRSLFAEVSEGTPVTIIDQPVKFGWKGKDLYLEIHPDQEQADHLEASGRFKATEIPNLELLITIAAGEEAPRLDWQVIRAAAQERRGVPVIVTRSVERADPG